MATFTCGCGKKATWFLRVLDENGKPIQSTTESMGTATCTVHLNAALMPLRGRNVNVRDVRGIRE